MVLHQFTVNNMRSPSGCHTRWASDLDKADACHDSSSRALAGTEIVSYTPPYITDRVKMFVLQDCVKNLCTLPPNHPGYIEARKRLMTWVEALPEPNET